ncbi:MarR family transcriptional regulator [Corallococcus praedator]|uniref:MarR family transcriptional regulator n=1 Tax=Corallococcus praedator TaxID=2316724 RepID=A0ABX9Q9C9_9BACT|nr:MULTISPECIES: MarR family winged helix-turn-helix transcriptional regulator [Corallococcus]RKH06442.1 MarR family transcriptional regulator [Corallococcus sp. CA047B]RKH22660.1 MarR family transcriptional regulator [Corallococcus sp. CA031C]RKH96410.1 MarR family transcriptional regulator [Corallococcus praedator]
MSPLPRDAAAFTDLILEVFQLNGLLLQAGDRLSAPAGLTSARWQVLGVIDHGPATVAAVARTMGLARQSVQQTADALASDGFVTYVENPHHQRAKLLSLTAAGRRALRKVEAAHAAWANRLGASLAPGLLSAAVEGVREARLRLEKDLTPEDGAHET